ncbi:MAG: DUF6788 family protein [Acidimicrobiales bacterium]
MAMTDKRQDPAQRTTRQLRARRRRLARNLPEVEGLISGAVVEQKRRCGKEGCRCNSGELHGPYTYVVLPRAAGRTRTVYVPAGAAEAVRAGAAASAQLRAIVEEISAINIELLSRGELV